MSRTRLALRTRLAAAMATVLVVILLAAGAATYLSYRSYVFERADRSLTEVRFEVDRRRTDGHDDERFYVQIRTADGRTAFELVPPGADGTGERPPVADDLTGPLSDGPDGPAVYRTVRSDAGTFRLKVSTMPDGARLVIGVRIDDDLDGLRRLLWIEAAIAVVGVVVAAIAATLTVRAGLRPLQEVSSTAAAIAAGDLDRRVPDRGEGTEVGDVARAINAMLDRIHALFRERDRTEARLRRFVADASHELRTPVTGISAYAELVERGAAHRPDDLLRATRGIRTETDRMSRLIDELLELARLDNEPGGPNDPASSMTEQVELGAVARAAIDAAATTAPQHHVRLIASRPVEVTGSAAQLRRTFDNLLGNLATHTPIGTTAVLEVAEDAGGASIVYTDDGPGIDARSLEHIFERFWRVDPARTRASGGAGLGLAIVAAVVGAHGGRVRAEQVQPHGLRITIGLPAGEPAEQPG